jgi:hypothetical protein
MNLFINPKNKMRIAKTLIVCTSALLFFNSCIKLHDEPPTLTITTLADGFLGPLGLETDNYGRVWVAESGTGHNDGKVSVIKPNGQKYNAIINLESIITEGNETEGPSHLLFADGLLYILGAKGKMYKANVASFIPGSTPVNGSTLAFEDIGAFVLAYPFVNNTHQTHPYGITKAPDGAFYITDAAANAVLRRSKTGVLSVVAEVPGIPNPLPFGPPVVESVPTGVIVEDGKLLVSTLLGFPFPQGKAIIYTITPSGNVAVFQQGFTSLVDIIKGRHKGHLVVEHGIFGATGFTANTGRVVWANGSTITPLAAGLNLPAGIVQGNEHTWYVSSLGDNSVLKLSYR